MKLYPDGDKSLKNRNENIPKIDPFSFSINQKDDLGSSHFNLFGPRFPSDNLHLNSIKPTQDDLDNLSETQTQICNLNLHKTIGLRRSKAESANIQKKVTHLENEIRYLKSLLSKDYNSETLYFIEEILTKYFVKTSRLSSIGRTSSNQTGVLGKNSTQRGANLTSKFTSFNPDLVDSEEGILN